MNNGLNREVEFIVLVKPNSMITMIYSSYLQLIGDVIYNSQKFCLGQIYS